MSLDITCPYCGTEQTLDFDSDGIEYEDWYKSQVYCCECDKVINITVHIDVSLEAEECPCQLEHHKYRLQHVNPMAFAKWECESCGTMKELTDAQRKRLGIQTKEEYFEEIGKESQK